MRRPLGARGCASCPITIGERFRWMVLIGSRSTPGGSSSLRLNRRSRISALSRSASCGRIVCQVPDDQLVAVGRVRGERPHHRQAPAVDAVHARRRAGTVRAGRAPRRSRAITACLLRSRRQKSHSRGCACRTSRANAIVARTSDSASWAAAWARPLAAVRCSSLNDGLPSAWRRPDDAVRAQRVAAAQHVEQVPASAVVLPLAGIRIDQVAPEQEARHLVVEADAVVADADRPRLRQFGFDRGGEFMLGDALGQAALRQDAGQQAGFGLGQVVRRRTAIQHPRAADLVQLGIGAHAGKLCRPVAARRTTEGFVVVPVETRAAHRQNDSASKALSLPGAGP